MKSFDVQVEADHIAKLARARRPLLALAELIWNALDAEATEVRVEFRDNALDHLEEIRVSDNGCGIPFSNAEGLFGKLGGSWKLGKRTTPNEHRIVHGRDGKGRFRAFALGRLVEWKTIARDADGLQQYTISSSVDRLGRFTISDPEPSNAASGTAVRIAEIDKDHPSLRFPRAESEVMQLFSLYLTQYPNVRLTYDRQVIAPSEAISGTKSYPLSIDLPDGEPLDAELVVVEWKLPIERALMLCDRDGFTYESTPPGIQAPGFNFTAYLKADLIRQLHDGGALELGEMNPPLQKLLDVAKAQLREHFRRRAADEAADLVQEWKADRVYPYEDAPSTVLERVERDVFDVVALNVNSYLPSFSSLDNRSKKFSLSLLRRSLEQSPHALSRILSDVLDLPPAKQLELAELLEKTSLSAIISAAKMVADRLDFLRGLEILVFDPKSREQLLERRQLHRIVAQQTWIFGEEYALSVDDQSLTEVLAKHLHLLGRDSAGDEPVTRLDGTVGIVDLMLSRSIPQPRAEKREHLVVELKRPSVSIGLPARSQIEGYALAVAKDERFRDTDTRWVFVALSNEIDEHVRKAATQRDRPPGLLYQDADSPIEIWVKTWAQVIHDCRARLRFFEEHLGYNADSDSAVAYLRKVHAEHIPAALEDEVDSEEPAA